jgi:hypothetical protein
LKREIEVNKGAAHPTLPNKSTSNCLNHSQALPAMPHHHNFPQRVERRQHMRDTSLHIRGLVLTMQGLRILNNVFFKTYFVEAYSNFMHSLLVLVYAVNIM